MTEPNLGDLLGKNLSEWLLLHEDDKVRVEIDPAAIVKVGANIQISDTLAMDFGLIPDTRTHTPPSRRTRFRWWRQEKVYNARTRLASWIAGWDVTDRD